MQMNILTKNPTLSCLPIENFTLKGHTADRLTERLQQNQMFYISLYASFLISDLIKYSKFGHLFSQLFLKIIQKLLGTFP